MFNQRHIDSLNIIRWFSTVLIVTCHYLQAFDSDWAFVLNIGVQIFFFLSGFLYGTKGVQNPKHFYLGRLLKLYVPYLIWVLISIVILAIYDSSLISVNGIINQILMLRNINGLNHLWFMSVIFLCYAILPLVDKIVSRQSKVYTGSIIFLFVLILTLFYNAKFLWIALYYLGYFCSKFSKIQKYTLIFSMLISLWIIIFEGFTLPMFKENSFINNLLHAFGGVMIFLSLYKILNNIKIGTKFSQILTNGGGYEIYLTHHLFLIGPITLLFITDYNFINVCLSLIIIGLSTFGLIKTSQFLSKLLNKFGSIQSLGQVKIR